MEILNQGAEKYVLIPDFSIKVKTVTFIKRNLNFFPRKRVSKSTVQGMIANLVIWNAETTKHFRITSNTNEQTKEQ